jgi:probable phosphoglycerate mutase
MVKQIFVIRHGETDNNKAGIIQGRSINASINQLGRQQAESICEAVKPFTIQKIVASGLKRTHETAQPLADYLNLSIEKHPELDEIDFGILEGKSFSDIEVEMQEVHDKWVSGNVDFAPKNGESPREVFERANTKVQEVLQNSEEENIVFMVHGRLTRILLSEWLGYGLKNMHKIEHQNGAINHLIWQNGEFKAVELNMTDHLMELV